VAVIVAGKEFSEALLDELQELGASCSRRQLAQVVCDRLEWKAPAGKPQWMGARKALAQLQRQGHLRLAQCTFKLPACVPLEHFAQPLEAMPTSLAELGEVGLVLVRGRKSKQARLWRQIMAHHYLGTGPLCGAQLRYLIVSEAGYLGALAFSAAALKVKAREQFIGWNECSRRHHLHLLVNNSRFLILPWVKVQNLASHILAQCAWRLPHDWQERYGYRPLLLESFVDSERFSGTSYKAAGWQCIGQSSGRGRQDGQHQQQKSLKSIWLKALEPHWQQQLCSPPKKLRFVIAAKPPKPPTPPPSDWAEQEMGTAALGDQRLSQRLVTLSRHFFARPLAQIPEACGNRAATKAAYRFFEHEQVSLPIIIAPHREQTIERVAEQEVVLAVQDTTELDYTAHPLTEGLGPIGNHRPHVQGLILHPTMVYTSEGLALGLLDVQCWKRDPDHKIKFRKPIEQKESFKWLRSFAAAQELQRRCPGTMVLSVGDCEADLFELYSKAAQCPHGTKFLVRAYRERSLENESQQLWESLSQQQSAGTAEVHLPRRGARKARVALVDVRFGQVELRSPKCLKGACAVKLWAVVLKEEAPPGEASAVQWLLLTNVPVRSLEEAVEKTRWYGQRFQIEIFFRTLKSGCRIEDRQLGEARRLENCLAIDLVVAWRIVHLVKLGREVPELPCTVYFEEMQWKALVACSSKAANHQAIQNPPTLREAVRMVAQLGGFLGRKGDGEPGAQTLWRGLQRLDDITIGFTIAIQMGPVPSNPDYG
jgi:hypothetical protein